MTALDRSVSATGNSFGQLEYFIDSAGTGKRLCDRYYEVGKLDEFDEYLRHVIIQGYYFALGENGAVDF